MGNVSRPLIGLLVATVAFFALWIVALNPSSSSNRGPSKGLGAYQSAINAAHAAVATSKRAGAAAGGTVASPTSPTPSTTRTATQAGATSRPARSSASARVTAAATGLANHKQVTAVERALASDKVLALLFYNPAGTDDRAIKQELAAVPTHSGMVVKLAVSIAQLASYPVVTSQVPVTSSPTLVLIDRSRQAATLVGFADRFEIAQRVADAFGQ